MELVIDQQLKQCLKPLSEEELHQLTENCLADGKINDPIKVWHGTGKIIDGFHRYEIAEKNGLPFTVDDSYQFENMAEALLWIQTNQYGRRNLEGIQKTMVRAAIAANMIGTPQEEIADSLDVSPRIVRYDKETMDVVNEMPEDIQERVRSSNLIATSKDVRNLGKLNEKDRTDVYNQLREDPTKPLHSALPRQNKSGLSEEDLEFTKTLFEPPTQMQINTGSIAITPKDVARLRKMPGEKQQLVSSIISGGDAETIAEAVNMVAQPVKKPSAKELSSSSQERFKKIIESAMKEIDSQAERTQKTGDASHKKCITITRELLAAFSVMVKL